MGETPGTGLGGGILPRAPGSFPDRRSRGPDGVVEVVTAVIGANAAAAARPADALPDRPTGADCPNLPQRPRSSRSAREETLIFRPSSRGRSRPGAPLWQIWTRPRPGSPQETHQHHAEKNNLPRAAAGTVGRAVARLGEVHDVGAGADTGEAGGRRPGGHPVRPRRPRKSASADPAQAPRPTRSPLNPRERLLEVRSRGLPGDLGGQVTFSRVTRRSRGPRRRPPAAAHHRPPNNLPGLLDKIHLSSHDASSA